MKVLERENWYISLMLPRLAMTKLEVQDGAARRRGRVGEPRRVDLLVGMTCRAS